MFELVPMPVDSDDAVARNVKVGIRCEAAVKKSGKSLYTASRT